MNASQYRQGLRKALRRPFVVALLSGLVVFSLIHTIRAVGYLEFLELASYDWLIRLSPRGSEKVSRVTLIEISEDDIRKIGRWPLTDEVVAGALDRLLSLGPRVVGLDIYRDIPVPPGTDALKAVLAGDRRVVGVMKFGMGGGLGGAIGGSYRVGFNDIIVDEGGVVRRGLLFLDDGENSYTSFSMRLASLYLQADGIALESDPVNAQYIRLGNTTIKPLEADDGGYISADAAGYQFLLDFKESGLVRSFSFSDLVSGGVTEEDIGGKVVIIGVGAQSVKDYFYTPLSRGFREGQHITGVALHGRIVDQLLRFAYDGVRPILPLSEGGRIAWILIWSVGGAFLGLGTRSMWRFFAIAGAGLVALFLLAYFAFLIRFWAPLVPPALAFSVSAGVVTAYVSSREKAERAVLMQLFSRHVSREIADVIWKDKDRLLNSGRPRAQKMTATVFFSDLRGFTTMSERMEPRELFEWLNAYMESMAGVIMEHGGVVDDYFGDGIKANFGVPFPRKSRDEERLDALKAVKCALAMEAEMNRLNALWSAKGLPAMKARVGIHTGPIVAGLVGSSERLKYTTIGDTVNIAARIENYDKEIGSDSVCRILVGDSTMDYIGDAGFTAEKIGEASLRGRVNRVVIFRVLSRARHAGEAP